MIKVKIPLAENTISKKEIYLLAAWIKKMKNLLRVN